jgi:pyruvate/2-oxoacid:ferredoxin oxidoreductase alpha subunit
MTWPRDSQRQRADIESAMDSVPVVLEQALSSFESTFGRRPAGAFQAEDTGDADIVLVACGTMAQTAREVVKVRRARGERVGLVRAKLFRPFLRDEFVRAIGSATRVAVLDRDHSPGSGGIVWGEIAATLRARHDLLLQNYIVGLAGGDVAPAVIEDILDDVRQRPAAGAPHFVLEAVT